MSEYTSTPLSSAVTLSVRNDIQEILGNILDNFLYVDGYFSGDEYQGVASYILKCDGDYTIDIPFLNILSFKIGPDLVYVEVTFETRPTYFVGNEDEGDGYTLPAEGFTAYIRFEILKIQVSNKILKPVYLTPQGGYEVSPDPNEKVEFPLDIILRVNGDLEFDIIPQFNSNDTFSIPPCQIGNTKLIIHIQNGKLDLSRKSNIPEATAAGYANDFVGIYAEEAFIAFPQFWNHDAGGSTAMIKGRNLLVGTGGVSGIVSLESSPNAKALFRLGDPNNTGDQFQLSLTQFLIEFKQNSIVHSEIGGTMMIPGFKDINGDDAEIAVKVFIGNNGDFRVTASEADGVHLLRIPNVFALTLRSVTIGRENDRWFIEASGSLLFDIQIPNVESDFLKQAIDIKRIRIYQDGGMEFVGGGIALPTHASFKIGPVSLALSNIGFDSHESMHRGLLRKYFVFTFNGALSTGAGGVDVRGDGVEFHFTRDSGDFHSYLRIAGIGVDIKIPGNATEQSADVLIKGYLAIRHGAEGNYGTPSQPQYQVQDAGPDYQGSVSVTIRPLRIAAKASMNMRPKVPAWIVDVELELPTPLPLAATGLGIYGFRGLVGNHYVASKPYIGINPDDSWYEYLKKKVPPRNKQGIGIEKFDPAKKGFSLGVGATIATMGDNGWTFSAKVFVLLSMPEMLLIEGQANVLSKRLGIESENDPPFYAFLIIDSSSVQAGLGVNYKIPEGGQILALRGEMQLGFFFGNASGWYVNIGQELPENKRLQARLFTLFNVYAYLMVNSRGIKAGAGAKFEMEKRFGPVRVGLYAFIDTKGFISFRPIQIGGAIQLGGGVYLKVFGFGFEFRVAAGLSAEAPRPFIIAGFIEISIKVLFKRFRIKLSFTWVFNSQLNEDEVKLIDPADFAASTNGNGPQLPVKAINMLTGESFSIKLIDPLLGLPNPNALPDWNNYVIPMDSYIDVEFKRAVKPFTNRYGGGVNPLPVFEEYVAPQKSRSQQVKHTFSVESVELKIWNTTSNSWENYNPWEALTQAFVNAGLQVNTSSYPFGFWQYNNTPGKYSSLRILAQTPFAVSNGTAPEQFGILSQQILCQGTTRRFRCQYWNKFETDKVFPEGELRRDRDLWLRFNKTDGTIRTIINMFGVAPSLHANANSVVEIYFKEPVPAVQLRLTSLMGCNIQLFTRVFTGEETIEGLPHYQHELIAENEYSWDSLMEPVYLESPDQFISKIEIRQYDCDSEQAITIFEEYFNFLYHNWSPDHPDFEWWQRDQVNLWMEQYANGDGTPSIVHMVSLCNAWHQLRDGDKLDGAEYNVLSEWIDSYCGQTDFNAVLPELCSHWSTVMTDYETYPLLSQYAFLWHERYCKDSNYNEFDLCGLYIHEVCWMSEVDWQYNQLLYQNNQSVITTGINSLSQAINQALAPVWRPHSTYAIVLKTRDHLTTGNSTLRNYPNQYVLGFKTAGPLGFFHKTNPEYLKLENFQDPVTGQRVNKADQYKLANLRFYLDYQRSYPNADGKLINAKPMYYKNPKLGLYFEKPYVYEFYTRWDVYKGNSAREYKLESFIMDPLDKPDAAPVVPSQPMGWQVRMGQQSIPINALEVEVISNILSQSNPNCTGITTVLKPPVMVAEVERNYEIKPQKLYNAVFKAMEVGAPGNPESIVHNYSFETSRYKDFAEHIQSYKRKIKDPDTYQDVLQNAFLPLVIQKNAGDWSNINTKLQQILTNTLPTTDALIATYASVYDRIISGALQLQALQAVTGLELNVIKAVNTTSNTTTIPGILIKSPEPLNDPKLPPAQMGQTLQVVDQANPGNTFTHVFSKDNASVFITNTGLSLSPHLLHITFRYIRYNGVSYDTVATEMIPIDLNAI